MDTKELRNKGNKFTNVPVLMMIDDFNCCRLVILTLEPIGQAWTFFASEFQFDLHLIIAFLRPKMTFWPAERRIYWYYCVCDVDTKELRN